MAYRRGRKRTRGRITAPATGRGRGPKRSVKMQPWGGPRWGGYAGAGFPNSGCLKFHDVSLVDVVVPSTGVIIDSMCLIAQGITESTRIGRSCTIRKIGWKWSVELPETETDNDSCDAIRMIVFQDKQCNGATAAILDVLESATYHSFQNLANKGRFRILYNHTVDLNASSGGPASTTTTSYGCHAKSGEWHKKVNINLQYDAAAGAITELTSNNIGVILITSAGKCGVKLSQFRLRFDDNDC